MTTPVSTIETPKYTLYCGDCIEFMQGMEAGSVDLICTDPPYPREYEYLYGAMAKEAKRVLRIGGSLITLCGHYQLARILPDMSQYLKYRWIIKLDHPGAHARMAMGIIVTWKPMVWFVNEKFSPVRNVTDSAVSGKRSKDTKHPWQQDEDYARWAIESLTDEGNLVLDPFMGSGTTGLVALKINRRFIGCENNEQYFRIADAKIQEPLFTV